MGETHSGQAPFISVIVPVWGCEKVLHRCVESVLEQTFGDFELLLVDDGSPDGSGVLCDSYAARDPRVRAIHRENGGTSAARNTGLDAARGSYLMFMDNDDCWASDESLAHVVARLQEDDPDVLVFLYEECWQEEGRRVVPFEPQRDRDGSVIDTGIQSLVRDCVYGASVWQKAIRRSLVERAHIRFPEGLRNEDTAFSYQVLREAPTVRLLDEVVYVWYRGTAGASQSSGLPSRTGAVDLARQLTGWADDALATDEPLRGVLLEYLSPLYAIWMGYSRLYDDEEYRALCEELRPYAWLLSESSRSDIAAIRLAVRLLGMGLTSRLLALRYRLMARR